MAGAGDRIPPMPQLPIPPMPQLPVTGGAAGSKFGPGYVYVMRDRNQVKIGCSENPKERLEQIKRQEGRRYTELVRKVHAEEMNGAETAAQEAVKGLGMVKIANTPTDWFKKSTTINDTLKHEILDKVRNAVYYHNTRNKGTDQGRGYVYVKTEGNEVIIGYSKNNDATWCLAVKANEMTGARQAAHTAVIGLGMGNIAINRFEISEEIDDELLNNIIEKVKRAVYSHSARIRKQ